MTTAAALTSEGYVNVRQLPDGRWIGVRPMLYTVGLFVGLDDFGFNHRWCYPDLREAASAAARWDGVEPPPGRWIKRKPERV